MTKKKTKAKDPNARRKKVGDREETIVEKLSPMQVEDERAKVCDYMRTKKDLDDKRKSSNADFKARLADLEAKIGESLACVNTARRETQVTIEEWLTEGNEVVRVRSDTGEQIGKRTARAEELQEELFADDPPPNGDGAPRPGDGQTDGDDFGDAPDAS